jgi:hybrid cluster-associated redox disulfide protein
MPRRLIDDPDAPLQRLFERWPELGQVFLERRMLCFGCPIAPFHTVMDACLEYGLEEEELRAALHEAVLRTA